MTFEEWWYKKDEDLFVLDSADELREFAEAAWQAALQSERERAKELVEAAEHAAETLDQYVQRHAHALYVRAVIAKYKESPDNLEAFVRSVQEAERERILKIVEQVGIQGNHNEWFDCCDTIVERIKNDV